MSNVFRPLQQKSAVFMMSTLKTPQSIAGMMSEAAIAVSKAHTSNVKVALVEVPIPVTGGTELDDWPGGIKQKYSVLRPMMIEMMASLNFTASDYNKREYLDNNEDDAVGLWYCGPYILCCFPTVETIPSLIKYIDDTSIVVLINQQFFLDPMSKTESKEFLAAACMVYQMEQLNMRGPGALPIRGLLYRKFPDNFQVF